MFCGFPVTSTSCLHGGLASSLSLLALDSSSSFPCPAFRAIAKSTGKVSPFHYAGGLVLSLLRDLSAWRVTCYTFLVGP
ncbi:hypothetical protein STEG23_022773, partial [Scotinomys teguina]